MSDATTPAWIAAVSALGGVVVGLFGPWLTTTATAKREKEGRREARQDTAREKQNEFQRETLLALQEAAEALIRAAETLQGYNIVAGNRNPAAYPPKLAALSGNRFMRVAKLRVRVTDDSIRGLCMDLQRRYDEFLRSAGPLANATGINVMFSLYDRLNDAIGQRLRTLNDESTLL